MSPCRREIRFKRKKLGMVYQPDFIGASAINIFPGQRHPLCPAKPDVARQTKGA
jgi:hypothetical protein